jgi:hypothetical protein
MSYPTINTLDPKLDVEDAKKTELMFDMLTGTIHQIYEGDKVHSPSDYSKEDLTKFIDSLDTRTYKKINDFFNTMPKLKQEVEIENPKTKVKSTLTLQGLQDFFVLPSLTNR